MRPDYQGPWLLSLAGLSRGSSPDRLLRHRDKQKIHLLNQQFHPASVDHCSALQVSLANRNLFQYLRIKSFFGTTENAAKTQIWIAVSVYVLVAVVKKVLNIALSLGEILQILSIVLFEKVPMTQVLTKAVWQNEIARLHNQLLLFNL